MGIFPKRYTFFLQLGWFVGFAGIAYITFRTGGGPYCRRCTYYLYMSSWILNWFRYQWEKTVRCWRIYAYITSWISVCLCNECFVPHHYMHGLTVSLILGLITLPETNSSALKIDGWKSTFLSGRPIFRGELLVSGSVCDYINKYINIYTYTLGCSPSQDAIVTSEN